MMVNVEVASVVLLLLALPINVLARNMVWTMLSRESINGKKK